MAHFPKLSLVSKYMEFYSLYSLYSYNYQAFQMQYFSGIYIYK